MAKIRIRKETTGITKITSRMTKAGQQAFVNQVYADANQYAPMLSGDLRNQSSIGIDGKSITWNAPYARRHYYNQMVNYTTPGTGPKWDEKAKAIHGRSWTNVARKAMIDAK